MKDEKKTLESFYEALSESQKNKVEEKLKSLLKESYSTIPESNVNLIRYQIASDMFKIIKG